MNVLVIEDEQRLAELIGKTLRREFFEVTVRNDGFEGYDEAVTGAYDVIVLDRMLPSMDGMTILREIRQRRVDTPVLMLTALGDLPDRIHGLRAGADDYLGKPFAFEELLARVRALVRKRYQRRDSRLRVADLVLDPVTHKVVRGEREIKLTTKEYALLEYLMLNPGIVVTRTMISEHVWDINFDTFTNVIDVYISYLRRKIDRDHETKLIHTIKGRGYMITEGSPELHEP